MRGLDLLISILCCSIGLLGCGVLALPPSAFFTLILPLLEPRAPPPKGVGHACNEEEHAAAGVCQSSSVLLGLNPHCPRTHYAHPALASDRWILGRTTSTQPVGPQRWFQRPRPPTRSVTAPRPNSWSRAIPVSGWPPLPAQTSGCVCTERTLALWMWMLGEAVHPRAPMYHALMLAWTAERTLAPCWARYLPYPRAHTQPCCIAWHASCMYRERDGPQARTRMHAHLHALAGVWGCTACAVAARGIGMPSISLTP